MVIDVLWDNIKIIRIDKVNGMYISTAYHENLDAVRHSGFPLFFLKQINLVSDELPIIVKKRISNIYNIRGKLKFKDDIEEKELENYIAKYINETGCQRPTDKFKIHIEL